MMIKRLLNHQQSLDEFLIGRSIAALNTSEWEKLRVIAHLLEPCAESTVMLGGEVYVSASIVLPHIAHLLYLNKASDDDPAYVGRFKTSLTNDLDSRRSIMTANMFLKVATVLDPRHRSLKCIPSDQRAQVWSHLTSLVKLELEMDNSNANDNLSSDQQKDRPPANKRTRFAYEESDSETDSTSDRPAASTNGCREEASRLVDMYKSMPAVDIDSNPLQFWKLNNHSLGPLTNLAKKYLSCPGTSVPSERLFSNAGQVISKKEQA
jgi:hypothetical protein